MTSSDSSLSLGRDYSPCNQGISPHHRNTLEEGEMALRRQWAVTVIHEDGLFCFVGNTLEMLPYQTVLEIHPKTDLHIPRSTQRFR